MCDCRWPFPGKKKRHAGASDDAAANSGGGVTDLCRSLADFVAKVGEEEAAVGPQVVGEAAQLAREATANLAVTPAGGPGAGCALMMSSCTLRARTASGPKGSGIGMPATQRS